MLTISENLHYLGKPQALLCLELVCFCVCLCVPVSPVTLTEFCKLNGNKYFSAYIYKKL